jgi:hypothetical protein
VKAAAKPEIDSCTSALLAGIERLDGGRFPAPATIHSYWSDDWSNRRGVDHAAAGFDSVVERRWRLCA